MQGIVVRLSTFTFIAGLGQTITTLSCKTQDYCKVRFEICQGLLDSRINELSSCSQLDMVLDCYNEILLHNCYKSNKFYSEILLNLTNRKKDNI